MPSEDLSEPMAAEAATGHALGGDQHGANFIGYNWHPPVLNRWAMKGLYRETVEKAMAPSFDLN